MILIITKYCHGSIYGLGDAVHTIKQDPHQSEHSYSILKLNAQVHYHGYHEATS